ncbi:Notoamide biosynthesis cluster protein M' [Paramyrothecium foliicola]|nr:Notoamide biosynthesis cluster protein M' [Paramyrothecium foliicola]
MADHTLPNGNGKRESRRVSSAELHLGARSLFPAEGSRVHIILASANKLRNCSQCRSIFTEAFDLPENWWLQHYHNANGYFGCAEETTETGPSSNMNTWALFKVKQLNEQLQYQWIDFNILTRWDATKQQSTAVLLDFQPATAERLIASLNPAKTKLVSDPFYIYAMLADELAYLQDTAVWNIRDHVRAIEVGEWSSGKSEPDYRRLHDLARHAIHVTEMVDVGVNVMKSVIAQHQGLETQVLKHDVWKTVHTRLLNFKQMLGNLRCRSVSNHQRLQNEIQLAFNLVAQDASKASINISQATRADSASMKTVSILTLIFLPPTFICAIFSMSFFNFDPQDGWAVSDQFWMYWALAIPATLIAAAVYFWQNMLAVVKVIRQRTSKHHSDIP